MPSELVPFITPDALLAHWQGHRRLTRRVIEAFPDDKLFTFSVGGMRPFGALALELITMAVPMVQGAVSGDWNASSSREPRPKEELLRLWDESTEQLNALWPQIPPAALPGAADGVRPVPGRTARPHPLRHRQRDPSPRPGLRLPARAGHRAAALLRSELTLSGQATDHPRRSVIECRF